MKEYNSMSDSRREASNNLYPTGLGAGSRKHDLHSELVASGIVLFLALLLIAVWAVSVGS